MKNESWQHPFPTLDDKRFDKNKDGRLDATETFFRDMYLNEKNIKAEEYAKERQHKTKSNFSNSNSFEKPIQKETSEANASDGLQLLAILFALVALIGGIIFAIAVDTSLLVRALVCLAGVSIAVAIFKAVGIIE